MTVASLFIREFWVLWGVDLGAFLGAFGDGRGVLWDGLGPFGILLDGVLLI